MADAESSRISALEKCVLAVATQELAAQAALHLPCPCPAPIPVQLKTTTTERNRMLKAVTACPVFNLNTIPPFPCVFTVGPNVATLVLPFPLPFPHDPSPNTSPYVTTPPTALYQYRTYPRIRGIDQIVKVARTQSASETTRRKQNSVVYGNVAPTTTFFRKPAPIPACATTPRPIPPYPPAPPCQPFRLK